jgi:hypothetical protein
MSKKIIIPLIIVVLIITILSFNIYNKHKSENILNAISEMSEIEEDSDLSANEKLKQVYKDTEIINKTDFKGENGNYSLVEIKNSQNKLFNAYELYNYSTGTRENLGINSKVISFKISNENYISFICKGNIIQNTAEGFPYIENVFRIKAGNMDNDRHFYNNIEKYYSYVGEESDFGTEVKRDVLDFNITYTGIQVLFDETMYAGAPTVPQTNISYDDRKQQMIINIPKSKLSNNLKKEYSAVNFNPYIKSCSVTEKDDRVIIYIELFNSNFKYNVNYSTIALDTNNQILPFFDISFKN